VRCIGNSNYRITLNNEEQTTEDFNMLVNK
jgi:hypothetical protein